eukprot:6241027-Alexandrium_andersonii.AAC.1
MCSGKAGASSQRASWHWGTLGVLNDSSDRSAGTRACRPNVTRDPGARALTEALDGRTRPCASGRPFPTAVGGRRLRLVRASPRN